jgi:hypothetical protein
MGGRDPTPLIRLPQIGIYRNIFIKDESVHCGGTFKDRLARVALSRSAPATTFGAISYGNTAVSFARLLETDFEDRCFIAFVPEGFEEWSMGPSTAGSTISGRAIIEYLAARVHVVPVPLNDGILDDQRLMEAARRSNIDVANFVNVTEGVDVPAYVGIIREAAEQLGRVPDISIVQFGAGILCNETIDFHRVAGHGNVIPISVPTPHSRARMLYGPVWLDTDELQRTGTSFSRHRSPDRVGQIRRPYAVHEVTERMIDDGLALARQFGINAEPSGSAGLGFLAHLPESLRPEVDRDATILLINTGNGIDALLQAA